MGDVAVQPTTMPSFEDTPEAAGARVDASRGLLPKAFLAQARREAARYGDDPWLFLREWVQNARDAGATQAHFAIEALQPGWVRVSCRDDGCGMSRDDVENRLLRLYATSKDDADADGESLGRFGVGFWSVLLARPQRIGIQSRHGSGSTLVEVHVAEGWVAEGAPVASPASGGEGPGTTVWADLEVGDVKRARRQAHERLLQDAGNVRARRGAAPLQVWMQGERVQQTLAQAAQAAAPFVLEDVDDKEFDAVVGLGRRPVVRLYSGGLLVREETSLEALLPRHARAPMDLAGLFPVVLVNADRFDVLLSRREVSETPLLERVVRTAERRLSRQQAALVEQVAPMALGLRLRLLWGGRGRGWAAKLAAAMTVVVLALGVGVWAGQRWQAPFSTSLLPSSASTGGPAAAGQGSPPAGPQPVGDVQPPQAGPQVDTLRPQAHLWAFRYAGGGPQPLFRWDTWSVPDAKRGMVPPGKRERRRRHPALEAARGRKSAVLETTEAVWVALGAEQGPLSLALPVPLGHVLDVDTLEADPPAPLQAWLRNDGVAVVEGELQGDTQLHYRTVPGRWRQRPAKATPTSEPWPAAARGWVRKVRSQKGARRRARRVKRLVEQKLRYTIDVDDAATFAAATGDFLPKVFGLGFGDCDVLNAIAARLLLDAGVPAQVGVGFVGEDGTLAPQLHAWTEYWDGRRWRTFDVSRQPTSSALAPAPASTTRPSAGRAQPTARPAPVAAAPAMSPPRGTAEQPVAGVAADAEWAAGVDENAVDRDDPTSMWVLGLGASGLGLLLLAGGLLWLRRRRQHPDKGVAEDALALMVVHQARHGEGPDPLHLRQRPLLPSTSKHKLSLQQLQAMSARRELLCVDDDDAPQWRSRHVLRGGQMAATLEAATPHLINVWWRDDDDSAAGQQLRTTLRATFAELGVDVEVGVSSTLSSALQEAWAPDGRGVVWVVPSPANGNAKSNVFDVVANATSASVALRHWRPALLASFAQRLLDAPEAP